MISIYSSIYYHLVINSKNVDIKDYFRLALYTDYNGVKPIMFKEKLGKTVRVDLTQDIDEIFGKMKTNYRNEVRRAIKEGIEFYQSSDLESFICFYNSFAEKKGLQKISSRNVSKYPNYFLTKAVYKGAILCYHALIYDEVAQKVYLLYSASNRLDDEIDTKIIGIANKFLHYKEFELFKNNNVKLYDFSGIVEDPNNREEYGIGNFKKGFGGDIVEYNALYSPIMYLVLLLTNRL